jgi:fumagillin biosynthesis dioxygenase
MRSIRGAPRSRGADGRATMIAEPPVVVQEGHGAAGSVSAQIPDVPDDLASCVLWNADLELASITLDDPDRLRVVWKARRGDGRVEALVGRAGSAGPWQMHLGRAAVSYRAHLDGEGAALHDSASLAIRGVARWVDGAIAAHPAASLEGSLAGPRGDGLVFDHLGLRTMLAPELREGRDFGPWRFEDLCLGGYARTLDRTLPDFVLTFEHRIDARALRLFVLPRAHAPRAVAHGAHLALVHEAGSGVDHPDAAPLVSLLGLLLRLRDTPDRAFTLRDPSAPAWATRAPEGESAAHLAGVAERGYTVLPGLLTADQLARGRAILDEARGAAGTPEVWNLGNLTNRDALFRDLVQHPRILEIVETLLGDDCVLSGTYARVSGPGGGHQPLHRDTDLWGPSMDGFGEALGVTFGVLFDDFSRETGGTRVVPRSHVDRALGEPDGVVHVEAPAGAAVAWDMRLLHGGSENLGASLRRGVFVTYVRSWIKPQTDSRRSTDGEVLAGASSTLLRLLGFHRQPTVEAGEGSALIVPARGATAFYGGRAGTG